MHGKDCYNREDLGELRKVIVTRIDRTVQNHKVKLAELHGRLEQLDDMLLQLDIVSAGEDTTNLPPNNTDTFKE